MYITPTMKSKLRRFLHPPQDNTCIHSYTRLIVVSTHSVSFIPKVNPLVTCHLRQSGKSPIRRAVLPYRPLRGYRRVKGQPCSESRDIIAREKRKDSHLPKIS